MGIIELIIIVWVIIAIVKKSQKKGSVRPGVPSQPNTAPINQEELKRRLQDKYAGRTATQSVKNVQNVSRKEYIPPKKKDILAQASANAAEADLQQIYDVSVHQQESELMKTVSDIMAKGVNTELSFQRDFVAEGMDMINNMTL